MRMDDFDYMERAIALAEEAAEAGEIPVGAIVVHRATGEILGEGRNRRESDRSPTAHAEILAIEQAAGKIGSWRLDDCILYVTLEPCPMCAGAIVNARIDRVVFGAYNAESGAVVSAARIFDFPFGHRPRVTEGLLEYRCTEILRNFFSRIRHKSDGICQG